MFAGGSLDRAMRNGARAQKWENAQPYDVETAARDINTSENVLIDIALNATGRCINMVASNRSSTEKVMLALLSNFPTREMRVRMTKNKSTTTSILDKLYPDPVDEGLRTPILKHKNVSKELLIKNLPTSFSIHWKWHSNVRAAVMNPTVPIELLYPVADFVPDDTVSAKIKARRSELDDYFMQEYNVDSSMLPHETVVHLLSQ